MAKKDRISRLGTKPPAPPKPIVLRQSGAHLGDRARAFTATVTALGAFNDRERVAVLAAVAEFYGLTLVVEN